MAHVVVSEADAFVKWFDKNKGFGFFEVEGFLDVFVHVTKLETFQPWELQEGAPAVISFETGSNGKLQVTKIHMISLGYVKKAGDQFCLPEPVAETPSETPAPAPDNVVILQAGGQYQGRVARVEQGGFGFLKVEGVAKFLFFHFKALPDPTIKPTVEQIYSFTIGRNEKGLVALDLKLVDSSAATADTAETAAVEVKSSDPEPKPRKLKRKDRAAAEAVTPAIEGLPETVTTDVVEESPAETDSHGTMAAAMIAAGVTSVSAQAAPAAA